MRKTYPKRSGTVTHNATLVLRTDLRLNRTDTVLIATSDFIPRPICMGYVAIQGPKSSFDVAGRRSWLCCDF
jgi:hypothetical protein